MKKVLILAYDFPPYNSIGGQRPYSWFLYFKALGIEPTVVTRHWYIEIKNPEDCYLPSIATTTKVETSELGTVIRAPFTPLLRDRLIGSKGKFTSVFRKALTAWQMVTEHHVPASDSRYAIYLAAREYLKSNKVDAIIATGEPFILFTHAYRLSKEFDTPWIADYRDGWSTNYHLAESGITRWIQKNIHLPLEEKMLPHAAAITTAAPSFAGEISSLLNDKKVDVIYNGFFEEKFENLKNIELKQRFTIAHAGTVYPYQRVETMIDGLREFVLKSPEQEIDLIFYGLNFQPDQLARIKELSVGLPVKFTDRMPHDEMLQELASCHVLLLLATPEKQQIYAKVFDYLALEKPIMLVENDKGPLEEILLDHEGSIMCTDEMEVTVGIEHSVISSKDSIPQSKNIDQFSRKTQAERMIQLINRL